MTNDEARRNDEAKMKASTRGYSFRHSDFVILRDAHAGNLSNL